MTTEFKSLDFQTIERASEKYENLKEVLVTLEVDGKLESFKVEVFKHFAPTQIAQCTQEIIEKLDHVKVVNKGRLESIATPYMIFLFIKHFTTLELPNEFAQQLKAIENLTDTGAMFQIFLAFDMDEVGKVQSEIARVLENFDSNMDEVEIFKEQIKLKLTDKSLLE